MIKNGTTESEGSDQSYFKKVSYFFLSNLLAAQRTFRWYFNNTRYNGTSLYGNVRFLGVTHQSGHPITGRLPQVLNNQGQDVSSDIVNHIGSQAAADPRGRCTYFITNQSMVFLSHPSDLKQVFGRNWERVSRAEAVEYNFAHGFGKHNLFTMPNDPDQRRQRKLLKERVYTDPALDRAAALMINPIQAWIDQLNHQPSPHELERITTQVTMEVAGTVILGGKPGLSSSVERFSLAFADLLKTIFDYSHLWTQFKAEAGRKIGLKMEVTPLERDRAALEELVTSEFIDPNTDQLRSTPCFLRDYAQMTQPGVADTDLDFGTQLMMEQEKLLLLVGHDTTARLLQFTLMNLMKHPEVLSKVKAEIEEVGKIDCNWTREAVEKLTYLDQILKETLRLNPPVPIIAYRVKEPILIAEIPDDKPYNEAMSHRDETKDITLQAGEIVIFSPYCSHRLHFDEPEHFDPDRFSPDKKINPYTYFPFGLGVRNCPGQRFAMLEAKLVIVHLIQAAEFTLRKDLSYPFPLELLGTIRSAQPVEINYTLRS